VTTTADLIRSDAATAALIQRLRKTGHLIIGASEDEQALRHTEARHRADESIAQLERTLSAWARQALTSA